MQNGHPSGMPALADILRLREQQSPTARMITPKELASVHFQNETPQRVFFIENAEERFGRTAAIINSINDHPGVNVICSYSVKTNPDGRILQIARKHGFFVECISQLEVQSVIKLGYSTNSIVLNGPAKWWPYKIHQTPQIIFADSLQELRDSYGILNDVAVVGIRISPRITKSRFGTVLLEDQNFEELSLALKLLPNKTRIGLHFHVQSSVIGNNTWLWLAKALTGLIIRLERTLGRHIETLDLGGGWHPDDWFDFLTVLKIELVPHFSQRTNIQTILLEPGKALVQPCMGLVSRIISIRSAEEIVVDASIAELPDIGSFPHRIFYRKQGSLDRHRAQKGNIRICGRLCMEQDILATNIMLPKGFQAGDEILFHDAGAYDCSMSYKFGRGTNISL